MDNVKRQIGYACPDTINGRITGRGVRAAILDTGAYPHPDFKGRVIGFHSTRILPVASWDGRTVYRERKPYMMTTDTEPMWQEFLPETGKCPVEGMQGWHRE